MFNNELSTQEKQMIAAFRDGDMLGTLRVMYGCQDDGAPLADGDTQPLVVPSVPASPVAALVKSVKLPIKWRRPFKVSRGELMGISPDMRVLEVVLFGRWYVNLIVFGEAWIGEADPDDEA